MWRQNPPDIVMMTHLPIPHRPINHSILLYNQDLLIANRFRCD